MSVMKTTLSRSNGFSLLEVVAAILVVGVALVAVAQMFILGIKDLSLGEDRLNAVNLLQRKVEEIKSRRFDDVISEGDSTYSGFESYIFNVTVSPYPEPPNDLPGLKKVEVTVRWEPAGAGVGGRETVTTLIADEET